MTKVSIDTIGSSSVNVTFWRFLFKWYKNMRAFIRMGDKVGNYFKIGKGTRQGSLISPLLFNVFINDLLLDLKDSPHGLIHKELIINSVAYADDITLLAATVADLQILIDKCFKYSVK